MQPSRGEVIEQDSAVRFLALGAVKEVGASFGRDGIKGNDVTKPLCPPPRRVRFSMPSTLNALSIRFIAGWAAGVIGRVRPPVFF